ncbi:MAG: PHP domain-containing protein, partial [Oscillospiraceae bacterium]|nr:PHP domain-containing protein [Oscillospiraceae bacterium]
MELNIPFLNMFSHFVPDPDTAAVLSGADVLSAEIDPGSRLVRAQVYAPRYIPDRTAKQITEEICRLYQLHTLEVTFNHPASELSRMEPEALMALFVAEDSMSRGSLANAQWNWEGQILNVHLQANGKAELEKIVPAVCRKLKERFGVDVTIEFVAGEDLQGKDLFAEMERMRSQILENLPQQKAAEPKPEPVNNTQTIYGKPFKGKPIPMGELSLDMGFVVVEGKIFNMEHKELTKANAWVLHFDITDNTSSVHVSRYMDNKEAKPVVAALKKGDVVRVQGRMMVDNYTNETILRPNAIMPGTMKKRTDKAVGDKRVELHMHTAMSNMDALTNTAAAIKQAAAWGHRAVAITDHGCVQSFTDALHTIEGRGGAPKVAGTDEPIKILYGCEGYYVNDVDDTLAVRGSRDMAFDEEYIAFDLETTGLHPRFDRIIEIGAVRMKNGEELERFQTFVDPQQPLSPEVIKLTEITDEMLVGAPKLEEVLPKFMEFVGDRVLVAHNAGFDTTFIRRSCARLGVPCDITSVDTLTISQNLMPEMGRHKLDMVADVFQLGAFQHHRAGDDALVCGKIVAKLFEKLKAMGLSRISQINEAMLPLRPVHRAENMHAQHI